jgi:hypothetical protein
MKSMSEYVCVPACSVSIYVCVSTGAYVEKGFEMHVLPLLFLKDGFELLPSTCLPDLQVEATCAAVIF